MSTVDIYNNSLTRTTGNGLSVARRKLTSTTIGDYAIFAGGAYGGTNGSYSTYSVVDIYNNSLTRTIGTDLSIAKCDLSAATVGNYAIFAGGSISVASQAATSTVDVYNSVLTRSIGTDLSQSSCYLSSTTIENNAIFAGGEHLGDRGNIGYVSAVNIYNNELTHTIGTDLSIAKSNLASTTVGNYAIFAGGSTVDVYTVE